MQPDDAAAHQEEQCEDREFRGRQTLLAAIAVVPGEDQHDRQADQECKDCELAELFRPVESLADVFEALQDSPGAGGVRNSPLHHLAAAQPGPDALTPTLGRRVGHVRVPQEPSLNALR